MTEDEDDGHKIDPEQVMYFTNRREFLSKQRLHCPVCRGDQVQLIAYHKEPAVWKCRDTKCRSIFHWEPKK